jgi:hypothetical protein
MKCNRSHIGIFRGLRFEPDIYPPLADLPASGETILGQRTFLRWLVVTKE